MVRSSAKNCNDVTIVVDPKNYGIVLEEMKKGPVSLETRQRLSRDAFAHTARSVSYTHLTLPTILLV